jgi:hypothetical protein
VPLFHSSPEAHFSSARPENKPNTKNLQSSGVRRARACVRVRAFARAQAAGGSVRYRSGMGTSSEARAEVNNGFRFKLWRNYWCNYWV